MMRANDGAVDHLQGVRDGPALVRRLKDVFPQPSQSSPSKLPVNTGPFAERFGQVAPRRTGPCDLEYPI